MGAEVIILANPYTYNFLKGLTHSALADRHSPSLVTAIIAVRVSVAEELSGKAHAVAASGLTDGTERFLRVVQRLCHHLLRHHFAIVHLIRSV